MQKINSAKMVLAFILDLGVASPPAHAALTMPTVDTSDVATVVTWAIALMATVFAAKLGVPLAKWAFGAVRGFFGR